MDTVITELANERPEKSNWHFLHLLFALLVGFSTQQVFLVCLCNTGVAKGMLGLIVLGLIALRAIVAYFRHERNRGWIVYAVLAYTSAGWIEILSRIILGPNGH